MLAATGCSYFDSHSDIYGRWRAEQLTVAGLSIPIAPNIEFSRTHVTLEGVVQEVDSYEKQGNRITVHMKKSASLSFEFQSSREMTFAVPLLGPLKYTKIK